MDASDDVASIVERMGDPRAVDDGRAFVNGARATASTALRPGDIVEVWAARDRAVGALDVLHRTDDWIAVDKPASLPTIADHRGSDCVVARVAALVGDDVHPASRLDVGVSGVILLATTPTGRRVLDDATRAGTLEKSYVGIVKGDLPDAGRVTTPVDGKPAATRYRTIGRARGASLVRFELETGRLHQIREHAASLRAPLFGDRKRRGPPSLIGADGRVVALDRVLLHAFRARLRVGGTATRVDAPTPLALTDAWALLGGDARAWVALDA